MGERGTANEPRAVLLSRSGQRLLRHSRLLPEPADPRLMNRRTEQRLRARQRMISRTAPWGYMAEKECSRRRNRSRPHRPAPHRNDRALQQTPRPIRHHRSEEGHGAETPQPDDATDPRGRSNAGCQPAAPEPAVGGASLPASRRRDRPASAGVTPSILPRSKKCTCFGETGVIARDLRQICGATPAIHVCRRWRRRASWPTGSTRRV